jgi:hypothetical protein
LKKQVAVSFEGNLVKVVYASQDKGRVVVQKTIMLRDDEFDTFLKANKMPNLSVVYPFRKFYSDIIPAPPVKKRAYLETIVESEIKKRFPELNNFSFFFSVLADKHTEEKGAREVFFFAVDNIEINRVIDRFDRYGKVVKFIYPDILTLSHFAHSQDTAAYKTALCLLTSDADKALFLVKNGQLRFIRVTASTERDILDTDIDNINMTVSYCRQQLRQNPEQVCLLNCSINKEETKGNTVIPVVQVEYPEKIAIPEETFRDFITPLSSIIFSDILRNDNLLPKTYKVLYIQRFAVVYSSVFFLLFAFIGMSYLIINLTEIFSLQGKIETLRKELTGADSIIAAYDKSSAGLHQILPLINLINEARSAPDIQKAIVALNFLPMDDIDIQNIQINNKKDSLQLQISGKIHAQNLGNMHGKFQKLLNNFDKVSSMMILTRSLDLKNGQFQVDIEQKTP